MASNSKRTEVFLSIIAVILTACSLCVAIVALGPGFPTVFSWVSDYTRNFNSLKVGLYEDFSPAFKNYLLPRAPLNEDEVIDTNALLPVFFPTGNHLTISAKNLKIRDEIILKKKIPIQIISYVPENKKFNVYTENYVSGGGPEYFWNFIATINPDEKIAEAVFDQEGQDVIDSYRQNLPPDTLPKGNEPDYFSLDPGETDLFAIEIRFTKPGKYEFRVGVDYYDEDVSKVKWIEKIFTAYVPANFDHLVRVYDSTDMTKPKTKRLLKCNFKNYIVGEFGSLITESYDCTNTE